MGDALRRSARLVLSLLLCLRLAGPLETCLNGCTCKWKNGKQTVECIGANLPEVPSGLSGMTQVLDLTGNLLQSLPSKVFQQKGLVNLQKVYASRCGLLRIADDAFYQLSNLVEMDLSSNFLVSVPVVALRDCPLLRRLQFSHNPIQRIDNDSFVTLVHLTTLELSNCQIEEVQANAFEGLRSLEYLKLDGNKLRTLPAEVVKPFTTLYALELHHNPWECDCRIRAVRVWMGNNNVPISSPPHCSQPSRLRGLTWDTVHIDEFACPPEIFAMERHVTFVEGENATLRCKIHAIPEATVNWVWRGRVVGNLTLMSFGRQMYLIRDAGTTQKISSLNIYNVMLKDSGRYLCIATNPAGKVAVNISLSVVSKVVEQTGLSGEEIAGIVIGVFFVLIVIFVMFCLVVLRHRRSSTDKRKSTGITVYKHFFSFNHSNVDSTTKNEENMADGQCNANALQENPKAKAYPPDVAKSNATLEYNYVKEVSPSGTYLNSASAQRNTSDQEEDIELSLYPSGRQDNKSDKIIWQSAAADDIDDRFIRRGEHYSNDEDVRYSDSSLATGESYYLDAEIPSLKCGLWPLSEGSYKDESYHSYSSPSQSSWKRSSVVIPQQVHHVLSPDARDSPDEGLGDEREYETDILD